MNQYIQIPYFRYYLTNRSHPHYGCIVVDDVVIHRIKDILEFYRAIGYTTELQEANVDPEVFIWTEYTQDNAVKASVCLQANIVEYLNRHSQLFREKYGSEYEGWAGKCAAKNVRFNAACTGCRMHPLNSKK